MTEKFLSCAELLLLSARGQSKEDLEARDMDNQSLFLCINNQKTFNTLVFNIFVFEIVIDAVVGHSVFPCPWNTIHIMYL